jgi:hypothetical protein
MPHYHKHAWEGLTIEAKPRGIQRLLRAFPLLTGSNPRFTVAIKDASGNLPILDASVELSTPDGRNRTVEILSHHDRPPSSIDKLVKLDPVALSGDHRVEVHVSLSHAVHHTHTEVDVVTFRAVAQETVTLLIVGAILALFSGVVGGVIVHLLSGGQPTD